jgi:hypothetical protein
MATDDLRTRLARLRGVIEGLRATCEAATPGPWGEGYIERDCIATMGGKGFVVLRKTNGGEFPSPRNAQFICASRTWLPRLLSLAEARLQEAERLDPVHDCGAIAERLAELERCLLPEEPK